MLMNEQMQTSLFSRLLLFANTKTVEQISEAINKNLEEIQRFGALILPISCVAISCQYFSDINGNELQSEFVTMNETSRARPLKENFFLTIHKPDWLCQLFYLFIPVVDVLNKDLHPNNHFDSRMQRKTRQQSQK